MIRLELGDIQRNPYTIGFPVDPENRIGESHHDILNLLNMNDAVAIMGGYRSGKSTDLHSVRSALASSGKDCQQFSLAGHGYTNPEKFMSQIGQRVDAYSQGCVVIVDELAVEKSIFCTELLKLLKEANEKKGIKSVLAVFGDIRKPSKYYPEAMRQAIVNLVGNSYVIKKLATDEEIKTLLNKHLSLSSEITDILIQQAGGHLMLAQMIGAVAWEQVSCGIEITPESAMKLCREMVGNNPIIWSDNISLILTVGLDPQKVRCLQNPEDEVYAHILLSKRSK